MLSRMMAPILGLVIALSAPVTAAVSLAPQNPAQQAFAKFAALNAQEKLQSPEAKKLFTGEAKDYSRIPTFGPLSSPDAFILLTPSTAVTRVQALEEGKPVSDLYFYLTKVGGAWKVAATRSMAMTGLLAGAREELLQKKKLSAQDRLTLTNINLALSTDRDLRVFLSAHKPELERLRAMAKNSPVAALAALRKLGFQTLDRHSDAFEKFIIGGLVDNTVGFIYSPSNLPPQISMNEYIWVEKITEKWFLYRTT